MNYPKNVLKQLWLFLIAAFFMTKITLAQTSPDETIDTSGLEIEIVTDGIDTVFYFGDEVVSDSVAGRFGSSSKYYNNSTSYNAKIGVLDSNIYVRIGNSTKTVNEGLLGYHLGGVFDDQTIPVDSTSLDQWDWFSGLRPESVRIFSGSFSKFMHPLKGPGYGYNLEEIIRFYDNTDSIIDSVLLLDALDDNEDSLELWINPDEVGQFTKYRTKYLSQVDIDSTRKYLDDFLLMIKKVETENPGHRVKVIVCLDIMSSSANECADMVKYIRANDIWDCEVAYVEVGNEMYFSFAESMLGIYTFDDYWNYINGGYPDELSQYVVGDSVWFNHDYISAFKSDATFNMKLAIPARNLGSGFVFFNTEPEERIVAASNWNDSLAAHYLDSIEVGTSGIYIKKFDGVVLHPYYDESNWEGIPDTTLLDNYPCINLADADTTNDEWTYGLYDDRLEWAFDSITYNFRTLLRNGYIESYLEHNDHLKFYLSVAEGGKDLITTEYNFKYEGSENKIGVYGQSFLHAEMLMEWVLRNIKINYNANFRPGFFKYATVQNFAGGTDNCLLSIANQRELEFLGKDTIPYNLTPADSGFRNYNMKRTPYFAMELLSEIGKQNLRYVQSNFTIFINSYNNQPTIFTNPTKTFLYLYFTNVRDAEQRILINTDYTAGFYTGGYKIKITDTATIYCVNALKNYSTSGEGKNSLADLNGCYGDSILFPIEITQIDTLVNVPDGSGDPLKCIKVPSYSFGIIKIPIAADIPLKESDVLNSYNVILYPNPAANAVSILEPSLQTGRNQKLYCTIYNATGAICRQTNIENGGSIQVADLAHGVYTILINFDNGDSTTVQFVKQ
jgi:hypothetical protein